MLVIRFLWTTVIGIRDWRKNTPEGLKPWQAPWARRALAACLTLFLCTALVDTQALLVVRIKWNEARLIELGMQAIAGPDASSRAAAASGPLGVTSVLYVPGRGLYFRDSWFGVHSGAELFYREEGGPLMGSPSPTITSWRFRHLSGNWWLAIATL